MAPYAVRDIRTGTKSHPTPDTHTIIKYSFFLCSEVFLADQNRSTSDQTIKVLECSFSVFLNQPAISGVLNPKMRPLFH